MSRETGRLTVLHLSDLHITADGLLYDAVDGVERIRTVSAYARQAGITPEAILVTGDLVQRGHANAYGRVDEALAELARTTGVPVLTTIGNHDDPDKARGLRGHEHGHYRVVLVDDLRFILLDSSTGRLGPAQIDWLRRALRDPHGIGTIVALHHPPMGSPLPALAKAGLQDAEAFLDALQHTDVRAVLAGHFHHPLFGTVSDVPVSVGPSLAYHQVMDAGPDRVSGHDSAMFSLMHLTPGGITTTSVSLDSPSPLFTSPITR